MRYNSPLSWPTIDVVRLRAALFYDAVHGHRTELDADEIRWRSDEISERLKSLWLMESAGVDLVMPS